MCLLRRKSAKAKENQMQTKLSFLTGGVSILSNTCVYDKKENMYTYDLISLTQIVL